LVEPCSRLVSRLQCEVSGMRSTHGTLLKDSRLKDENNLRIGNERGASHVSGVMLDASVQIPVQCLWMLSNPCTVLKGVEYVRLNVQNNFCDRCRYG
ncbi:hypothetical protein CEXT_590871, partial [Caerostris extrusa]